MTEEVQVVYSPAAKLQQLSRDVSVWLRNKGYALFDDDSDELEEDEVIYSGEIDIIASDKNLDDERFYAGHLTINVDETWELHHYGEEFMERARTLAMSLALEFGAEVLVTLEDIDPRTEYDSFYKPGPGSLGPTSYNSSSSQDNGCFAIGITVFVILLIASATIALLGPF